MSKKRLNGTVKWFDIEKRYGFLSTADGTDYFVHATGVRTKSITLEKGDKVSFQVVTRNVNGVKRQSAWDVSKDGKPEEGWTEVGPKGKARKGRFTPGVDIN